MISDEKSILFAGWDYEWRLQIARDRADNMAKENEAQHKKLLIELKK